MRGSSDVTSRGGAGDRLAGKEVDVVGNDEDGDKEGKE
jgi:hypothetical protein